MLDFHPFIVLVTALCARVAARLKSEQRETVSHPVGERKPNWSKLLGGYLQL